MSVNPGFGGQSFIESQVKKIVNLRKLCAEKVITPALSQNNLSSIGAQVYDRAGQGRSCADDFLKIFYNNPLSSPRSTSL
jgi:hypothetical protein